MRLSGCAVLTAAVLASGSIAAPSTDAHQHPYLADASQSASFMLTSSPAAPLFEWIHSALDKVVPKKHAVDPHKSAFLREAQYASLDLPDYSASSIWEVIQRDEHLSDLKKVLKYSGPRARELLDDKSKKLTFLAPVNWHHDKHDGGEEALAGLKSSQWSKIEGLIRSMESGLQAVSDDGDDDEDKKRKRKYLAYLIDATLEYHCIDGEEPLNAWDVSQNSSVATRLTIGKGRARDVLGNLMDGYPFRLRVGKSLLPRPSSYFNFYSRLVYPDVSVGDGSLLHAISLPLLIPPSALQTLFFSSPDLAGTTVALQKTHTENYFRFPVNHSAVHHDNHATLMALTGSDGAAHGHKHGGGGQHRHPRVPGHHGIPQAAITLFAPGNLAWYRLPVPFRLFLLSPWGTRVLGKILALHTVPGIFYADFVHVRGDHGKKDVKHSIIPAGELTRSPEWLWGPRSESPAVPFGDVDVTKYTFNTALPKLHFNHTHDDSVPALTTAFDADVADKIEFETVDVAVYRYKILPGGRGPLQTRVSVQGVPVTFQDIAVGNGAVHVVERFIRPKEHPHKDIWAHVAAEAEKYGFGSVDLTTTSF